MAKKKYEEQDGVWRTIGGRRVFIRKGQDLSSAMKESGKFKTRMNEKAVKGAREEDLKEQYKDSLNNVSKMEYNGEITREEYDKAVKDINKAYIDKRNSYLKGERNYEQVDKEWTDLAKKMEKDYDEFGTTNWKDEAKLNKLSNERDTLQYKENKKEYELYKRAKENPDSIDPMTENSTDWEALDKKYSSRYDKENNPIQSMANDRIKEKENTLNNDKILLDGMKKRGMKEIDGTTQEDLERRIKKNEDYLKVSKNGNDSKNWREQVKRNNELMEKELKDYEKERNTYESKVFGTDVTKADEQMKKVFGKDFHFAGEELYSDDPNRYGDIVRNHNERNALKDRYQGTYKYLQSTTNMSGAEILELLKKIDEDKK